MENTTLKIIIAIVLLAFLGYGSTMLTENPSLTLAIIPISLGMLTAIALVIQLVLRESVQPRREEKIKAFFFFHWCWCARAQSNLYIM